MLHVVDKCLNLGVQTSVNCGLQTLGSGINGIVLLLVEVHHNEVLAIGADELGHHLVNEVNGNHGHKLLHDFIFLLDRGHGLIVEVVAVVLGGKTTIGNLVALVVLALETAQVLLLGALILGGGKAVLGGTHGLGNNSLGGGFGHSLLGHDAQGEGVNGVGKQVVAVISRCLEIGAVGLLGFLAQAVVEHATHHAGEIVGKHINHVSLHLLGEGLMLEHHHYLAVLLLLVLVDDDNGLLVVGNGLVNNLSGIGIRSGQALEELLDLGLDVVNIHITHDNQSLVVGTIPLVVVVTQLVVLEVVHHAHQTDGHALAVLRTRVQRLELVLEHALLGAAAQAPLLVDHAALLVDLLVGEQQAVTPVLEDQQARVDSALAGAGHVVDVVNGLGNAGIGVQVLTEGYTQRAGIVDDALALAVEVLTAVEGHVLQEVGQTTLTFFLLDGAHALCDVEVHAVLGIIVVADVISQSAIQLANTHLIVHGDGTHLLCFGNIHAERHEHHEHYSKDFFHLHVID